MAKIKVKPILPVKAKVLKVGMVKKAHHHVVNEIPMHYPIRKSIRIIRPKMIGGIINSKLFTFLRRSGSLSTEPETPIIKTRSSTSSGELLTRAVTHRFRSDWKKDDFINLKKIGSGGFGRVYQAFAKPLQDQVALKYINRKNALRKHVDESAIMSEYNLHKRMSHLYFCRILGEFETTGNQVFVMDLCSNGDLHDYINQTSDKTYRISESRSLLFLKQLVSAIVYLHSKIGYIHMDLKPENILVTSHSMIKVTDFGSCVKIIRYRELQSFRNNRGGTQIYRPPEMLRREGFDATADVWAIGCIAYLLLTQTHPFFLECTDPKFKSEPQNTNRALERIEQIRAGKLLDNEYSEMSGDKIIFFRHIFGSSRSKRPLARDLDDLAWLSSYQ